MLPAIAALSELKGGLDKGSSNFLKTHHTFSITMKTLASLKMLNAYRLLE